jgi:hypothetical protein
MRIVARRLLAGWSSPVAGAVTTGVTVGLAGVTVVQQTILQFGLDPALTTGLLAGVWCGVWLGSRRDHSARDEGGMWDAVYLAALIGMWPFWLSTLMEGVGWLPSAVWDWPYTTELVGLLAGLASLSFPAAIGWRLLSAAERGLSPRWSSVVWGSVTAGMLLQATLLAPQWGLWIPAGIAAGLLVLRAVLWTSELQNPEVRNSAGQESVAQKMVDPVHAAHAPDSAPIRLGVDDVFAAAASAPREAEPAEAELLRGSNSDADSDWMGWLLSLTAGLLTCALTGLLSGLWPVSATLWHVPWGAVIAGMALGSVSRHSSRLTAALVMAGLAALGLVGGRLLTDWSLWLNATLTSAWGLEFGRMLTQGALLVPCGWAWARSTRGIRKVTPVRLACWGLGVVIAGCLANGRVSLLLAAVLGVTAAVVQLAGTPWIQSRPRWLLTAGLSAGVLLASMVGWRTWNPARPARLLFSTHLLLAARSGWDSRLLSHLDDQRLLTTARGRQGLWTVWQARGGEVQLRANGIPHGTLTTAPAWSPQYAPEVLPIAWPLVLVEQPARVLMLGARSGAALQAALVFPIREVVCVEPDAAVIDLIRGPLARACGHDPFADDRCRWVRQPESWLAPCSGEPFDVIVSQPATAALQACAEEFTAEFYQRAARRLSAEGVFCQRVASVDFGPEILLTAAAALQTALPETACLEVGVGEYLLLGAWRPEALVRPDLPQRLEAPHVAALLARCQWDWSLGLNVPAVDRAALAEAAHELHIANNTAAMGRLPFRAARELLRWGPKIQEITQLMTRPRGTAPVYPLPDRSGSPRPLVDDQPRQSRYLDWLGPEGEQPFVFRRLSEVVAQLQLVKTFPDTHWWEYRRELREQLQKHPRSGLSQVRHTTEWHPEDQQRKAYFEALGAATQQAQPDAERLAAVEALLEPYDPLLTLFAHQELAELYARGQTDPARELQHRLHVIYYAPSHDASVRNVVAAIDLVVRAPQAVPDAVQRFDVLNGLLQTLRARWEARNQRPPKTAKVTLQEIERSLLSVERGVATLQVLASAAGYSADDWSARQTVLERLLLSPFRTYRDELRLRLKQNEQATRALLHKAAAEN